MFVAYVFAYPKPPIFFNINEKDGNSLFIFL